MPQGNTTHEELITLLLAICQKFQESKSHTVLVVQEQLHTLILEIGRISSDSKIVSAAQQILSTFIGSMDTIAVEGHIETEKIEEFLGVLPFLDSVAESIKESCQCLKEQQRSIKKELKEFPSLCAKKCSELSAEITALEEQTRTLTSSIDSVEKQIEKNRESLTTLEILWHNPRNRDFATNRQDGLREGISQDERSLGRLQEELDQVRKCVQETQAILDQIPKTPQEIQQARDNLSRRISEITIEGNLIAAEANPLIKMVSSLKKEQKEIDKLRQQEESRIAKAQYVLECWRYICENNDEDTIVPFMWFYTRQEVQQLLEFEYELQPDEGFENGNMEAHIERVLSAAQTESFEDDVVITAAHFIKYASMNIDNTLYQLSFEDEHTAEISDYKLRPLFQVWIDSSDADETDVLPDVLNYQEHQEGEPLRTYNSYKIGFVPSNEESKRFQHLDNIDEERTFGKYRQEILRYENIYGFNIHSKLYLYTK